MNKRYDEFATSTPTPTDIILYANPTTGELKKTPLSAIGIAALVIYAANITQSGTSSPVVTELFSSIGSPVPSRIGTGTYLLTLAGAFTGNIQIINGTGSEGAAKQLLIYKLDDDNIRIDTLFAGAPIDDIITDLSFQIYRF